MNAAVRAVICTAVHHGVDVYAIHEGYHGLVTGGDLIKRMEPEDADGILHRGGTAIGTARSEEFRTRTAAGPPPGTWSSVASTHSLVIGGDGSLMGADLFRREWPDLLAELVDADEISPDAAKEHPFCVLLVWPVPSTTTCRAPT